MPKISKYRIINFKYGHEEEKKNGEIVKDDGRRRLLSDDVITCDGEMLLVEAPNSVGKSMCIHNLFQPILPLFNVSRKTVDVFTSKKPVYVLVEWILDDGETRFQTGIGLRRKSITATNKKSMYDYFTFTVASKESHPLDLENTPFINLLEDRKIYLGYEEAHEIIKEYAKKDTAVSLFSKSNSIEYGNHLREHGINQEEWSSTMIKLNQKESSLGSFFDNRGTVPKLVDLTISEIESVLLEKDGYKEIDKLRELALNYNQEYNSIKNEIHATSQMGKLKLALEEIVNNLDVIEAEKKTLGTHLSHMKHIRDNIVSSDKIALASNLALLEENKESLSNELFEVKKQETSYMYRQIENELEEISSSIANLKSLEIELNKKISKNEEDISLIEIKEISEEIEELNASLTAKLSARKKKEEDFSEIEKHISTLGYSIKLKYQDSIAKLDMELKEEETVLADICDNIDLKTKELKESVDNKNKLSIETAKLENNLDKYKEQLSEIKKMDSIGRFVQSDLMDKASFTKKRFDFELKLEEEEIASQKSNTEELLEQSRQCLVDKQKKTETIDENLLVHNNRLNKLILEQKEYNQIEKKIEKIKYNYDIQDVNLWDYSQLERERNRILAEKDESVRNINLDISKLKDKISVLDGEFSVSEDIMVKLSSYGIEATRGFDYLLKANLTTEDKDKLLSVKPLLPFGIIISQKMYDKMKGLELNVSIENVVPLFIRESLFDGEDCFSTNVIKEVKDMAFLATFTKELLDKEYTENLREVLGESIKEKEVSISNISSSKNRVIGDFSLDESILEKYTSKFGVEVELEIDELKRDIDRLEQESAKIEEEIEGLKASIDKSEYKLNHEIPDELKKIKTLAELGEKTDVLVSDLNSTLTQIDSHKKELLDLDRKEQELENEVSELRRNKESSISLISTMKHNLKSMQDSYSKFASYSNTEVIDGSLANLLAEYDSYKENNEYSTEQLNLEINALEKNISSKKKKMKSRIAKIKTFNESSLDFLNNESLDKEMLREQILEKIDTLKKESKATSDNIAALSENSGINKAELSKIFNTLKTDFSVESEEEILKMDDISSINFNEECNRIESELSSIDFNISDIESKIYDLDRVLDEIDSIGAELIYVEPVTTFFDKEVGAFVKDIFKLIKESKAKISTERERVVSLVDDALFVRVDSVDVDKIGVFSLLRENKYSIENKKELLTSFAVNIGKWIDLRKTQEENLDKKKDILESQIKQYLEKILREIEQINKISTFKGQRLFQIKIKESDVNMDRVSDVMEELISDDIRSEDDIFPLINSYGLFNTICSMGRVVIKVLLFEANNESSLINWKDISGTPSGAQKFCLSLVVLSIFMSYKRHSFNVSGDCTSSSKVLLIDNPFGETTDENFLRNIFSFAKQLDIQVISYTHIKAVRNNYKYVYSMVCRKIAGSNRDIVTISNLKKAKEKTEISNFTIKGRQRTFSEQDMFSALS